MVPPRRSVPAQAAVGATLMNVRGTTELYLPVMGDLVPNQAMTLPGHKSLARLFEPPGSYPDYEGPCRDGEGRALLLRPSS